MHNSGILLKTDTKYGHYEVFDTVYAGRRARLLYSGNHQAAQSGIAQDGGQDLLFDYNQRLVELVRGLLPKRILMVGGGAFTLPKAILEELPETHLDIVEIDGQLYDIAREYFGFKPSNITSLHFGDVRKLLAAEKHQYDC